MEYHFLGHHRLSLFFTTPNQCGAWLAMCCSALCAFYIRRTPCPKSRGFALSLELAILVSFVLVAFTYSRGAFIAVAGVLCFLGAVEAEKRRVVLGLLGAFVLVTLIIPAGMQRIRDVGHIASDASITNRIVLWRAAFAMAWDNFPWGRGLHGFREAFSSWYQPPDRFQVYVTGVSDYATLAGYWGIGVLGSIVGISVSLVALGIAALRLSGARLLAAVAVAICYLVAVAFSTLIITPTISLPFLGALAIIAVDATRSTRSAGLPIAPWVVRSAAVVVTCGVMFSVLSFVCARSFQVKPIRIGLVGLDAPEHIQFLRPRDGHSVGTIIIFADRWFPEMDARRLARPLCISGYDIVLLTPSGFNEAGVRECRKFVAAFAASEPTQPLYLLGFGEGGRMALLMGAESKQLSGIIAIASPFWHPLSSLSPIDEVKNLESRVLVIRDADDNLHNPSEAEAFIAAAVRSGIRAMLVTTQCEGDAPADYWQAIRGPLLAFLSTSPK